MSIGSPMQPLLQLSPEMLQHLGLGGFQQVPAQMQTGTDHTPLSLLHLLLTLMWGVATHTPALPQSIEMIDVSCSTITTQSTSSMQTVDSSPQSASTCTQTVVPTTYSRATQTPNMSKSIRFQTQSSTAQVPSNTGYAVEIPSIGTGFDRSANAEFPTPTQGPLRRSSRRR